MIVFRRDVGEFHIGSARSLANLIDQLLRDGPVTDDGDYGITPTKEGTLAITVEKVSNVDSSFRTRYYIGYIDMTLGTLNLMDGSPRAMHDRTDDEAERHRPHSPYGSHVEWNDDVSEVTHDSTMDSVL